MYRRGKIQDGAQGLEVLSDKIKTLEQTASRQALPKGYEFRVVGGQLVVYRLSDGAQAVIL